LLFRKKGATTREEALREREGSEKGQGESMKIAQFLFPPSSQEKAPRRKENAAFLERRNREQHDLTHCEHKHCRSHPQRLLSPKATEAKSRFSRNYATTKKKTKLSKKKPGLSQKTNKRGKTWGEEILWVGAETFSQWSEGDKTRRL